MTDVCRDDGGVAGITVRRVNDVRIVVIFGHPLRASHASPSLREGEGNGVLCFSLDSRVRGNDGGVAGITVRRVNDVLTRGNDGGVAGMTYRHAGMTLILPHHHHHSSTPVPQHPILKILPHLSHHSSKRTCIYPTSDIS